MVKFLFIRPLRMYEQRERRWRRGRRRWRRQRRQRLGGGLGRRRYCIVLYLYIYIALLAVHTNRKRFQCERPREERAVLSERKDALGTRVSKVDRVKGRSLVQKRRANDWKCSCLSHGSPRPRDKEIEVVVRMGYLAYPEPPRLLLRKSRKLRSESSAPSNITPTM